MRIDVYHHVGDGAYRDLATAIADATIAGLRPIIHQQGVTLMATLDDIRAAVARETEVTQGAVMLLQQLAQQLRDAIAAGADPAALSAIADGITANAQSMADAIVANTPAPAPVVVPPAPDLPQTGTGTPP